MKNTYNRPCEICRTNTVFYHTHGTHSYKRCGTSTASRRCKASLERWLSSTSGDSGFLTHRSKTWPSVKVSKCCNLEGVLKSFGGRIVGFGKITSLCQCQNNQKKLPKCMWKNPRPSLSWVVVYLVNDHEVVNVAVCYFGLSFV